MKLLFSNWPVLVFLGVVVSLMAVADMNWPSHMGERDALISAALVAAGL